MKPQKWAMGLAALGGALVALGMVLSPRAALGSVLTAGYWLTCMALFGVFFVSVQYASGASWSVAFRRVPEAMASTLPAGAAMIAAVLAFAPLLYPWVHEHGHFAGFKRVWLDLPFFLVRATIFLLLWWLFARLIVRCSRLQDATRDPGLTCRVTRLSVGFLVIFAITFSLASFDWVMSLEPHWYSTIFAIYNFAGMFSSGLAALILLLVWLRRTGPLRDFINAEHFHDLGKLLFGFTTFWMYIWFSQYMLIWYANITEESVYYIQRTQRYWGPLFLLNVILNWIFPFLALMPKRVKRTPHLLARVAAVVVIGRWLDLYLMIKPATGVANPSLAPWDIGAIFASTTIFLLLFQRAYRQAGPVPLADPRLEESLSYHN